MVFTSPPLNRAAEDEVARLIHLVCSEYTRLAGESLRPPVRLAQTLLGPSDSGGARAFESGGFCELARLAYMSRPMPLPSEFQQAAHWDLPTGVRCVRVSELSADRVQVRGILLEALGRSYEHTLDCPELCALREPDDVLDSHLAVGKYDPRWWWVVEAHGQPEGAMLFTPCPEQGGVELVYLGISPDLRGRGIAKVLLRSGMRELSLGIGTKSAKGRLHLSCAVDLKNQPARALYRALGFQMTAERRAFVRAIGS